MNIPSLKCIRKVVGLIAAATTLLLVVTWFVVTQPIFPDKRAGTAGPVSPKRLETHVRMLSETLLPRDYSHPENLDRVANYLRNEFSATSATVTEQPYEMEGKTYRNVIASFGPHTTERIVVGAHYDAFGELPGADDNASGVAGLIELAYLLEKCSLPLQVELVAFTLEEPRTVDGLGLFRSPYGGSAVHAKSLRERGVRVRIMLSLEMIGFFSDEEGSQSYPNPVLRWLYPSAGNFIMIVGRLQDGWITRGVKKAMNSASPLPVFSINAPVWIEGVDWSDHSSYWKEGYQAVMITDTALNRNRNYHTPEDTFDRLDYNRMAMVVQAVCTAVLAATGQLRGESK